MSSPESTPTHLPWATLCQSQLYPPVRDFEFGLRRMIYRKPNKHIMVGKEMPEMQDWPMSSDFRPKFQNLKINFF
jgi:hypothetical protein